MNCDTGHLVRDLGMVELHSRHQYTPLPAELHTAARHKLAGGNEAYVSKTPGGKLSKFAAKQRRKMAKQSRRRNRS